MDRAEKTLVTRARLSRPRMLRIGFAALALACAVPIGLNAYDKLTRVNEQARIPRHR